VTADPATLDLAARSAVVDASVAIKWLLPESHSSEALRLLSESYALLAPDLLFPEVGNVLWKRIRSGEIDEAKAAELLHWLTDLPIEIYSAGPLLTAALAIACGSGRTVYDSLYLALAVQERTVLVTADERLSNSLASGPLASHIVFVADVG
jgi:predicted nucleic acid-binding protein